MIVWYFVRITHRCWDHTRSCHFCFVLYWNGDSSYVQSPIVEFSSVSEIDFLWICLFHWILKLCGAFWWYAMLHELSLLSASQHHDWVWNTTWNSGCRDCIILVCTKFRVDLLCTVGSWWSQWVVMATHHCYWWWRMVSDILWATLIRLWLCSLEWYMWGKWSTFLPSSGNGDLSAISWRYMQCFICQLELFCCISECSKNAL